jgi:uncharacterized membrane protein
VPGDPRLGRTVDRTYPQADVGVDGKNTSPGKFVDDDGKNSDKHENNGGNYHAKNVLRMPQFLRRPRQNRVMAHDEVHLRTPRGLDRFIFFTDAVVAVAITLLILPLLDDANHMGEATAADYFVENWSRIFAFLLSFAVVGRLWIAHHQFSEVITDYSMLTLWLNMAWLVTIVALPVVTELMSSEQDSLAVSNGAYIVTILANMFIMLMLRRVYLRHPAMLTPAGLLRVREGILGMRVSIGLLLIALVISVTVTSVGLFAITLLFLTQPISRIIRNRGWRERAL